jgi:trimeric autotransporter adhesin
VLLLAAQDDSRGAMKQARAAHAAVLALHALGAGLARPPLRALALHATLAAQLGELRRALGRGVSQLVERLCCAFDAKLFDAVLALHVVDAHAGAELPARLRGAFALLVTANDQFSDDAAHEPSLLQKVVVQDILLGSYNKADIAPAALFKAIPRVNFRAALEEILQREFEWLQSFHAMQECVAAWLQEAQVAQAALAEGAAELAWRGGLPYVVLREEYGMEGSVPAAPVATASGVARGGAAAKHAAAGGGISAPLELEPSLGLRTGEESGSRSLRSPAALVSTTAESVAKEMSDAAHTRAKKGSAELWGDVSPSADKNGAAGGAAVAELDPAGAPASPAASHSSSNGKPEAITAKPTGSEGRDAGSPAHGENLLSGAEDSAGTAVETPDAQDSAASSPPEADNLSDASAEPSGTGSAEGPVEASMLSGSTVAEACRTDVADAKAPASSAAEKHAPGPQAPDQVAADTADRAPGPVSMGTPPQLALPTFQESLSGMDTAEMAAAGMQSPEDLLGALSPLDLLDVPDSVQQDAPAQGPAAGLTDAETHMHSPGLGSSLNNGEGLAADLPPAAQVDDKSSLAAAQNIAEDESSPVAADTLLHSSRDAAGVSLSAAPVSESPLQETAGSANREQPAPVPEAAVTDASRSASQSLPASLQVEDSSDAAAPDGGDGKARDGMANAMAAHAATSSNSSASADAPAAAAEDVANDRKLSSGSDLDIVEQEREASDASAPAPASAAASSVATAHAVFADIPTAESVAAGAAQALRHARSTAVPEPPPEPQPAPQLADDDKLERARAADRAYFLTEAQRAAVSRPRSRNAQAARSTPALTSHTPASGSPAQSRELPGAAVAHTQPSGLRSAHSASISALSDGLPTLADFQATQGEPASDPVSGEVSSQQAPLQAQDAASDTAEPLRAQTTQLRASRASSRSADGVSDPLAVAAVGSPRLETDAESEQRMRGAGNASECASDVASSTSGASAELPARLRGAVGSSAGSSRSSESSGSGGSSLDSADRSGSSGTEPSSQQSHGAPGSGMGAASAATPPDTAHALRMSGALSGASVTQHTASSSGVARELARGVSAPWEDLAAGLGGEGDAAEAIRGMGPTEFLKQRERILHKVRVKQARITLLAI